MAKKLSFYMSKQIIDKSAKPLRSREEAILLILYTIRMLDINDYMKDERDEKVYIYIEKMNRIFYESEDKIFTMQFPFNISKDDSTEEICIYDLNTGLHINSTILSFLIETFETLCNDEIEKNFDMFFDLIMAPKDSFETFEPDTMWKLVDYLLKYDLGYLRYDIDAEHENGDFHPLNHLDIFLDSQATFKIGLRKEINYEILSDILNVNRACLYLS